MSASEAHAAAQRAVRSQLVDGSARRVRGRNLLEFLEHGVRYVFPAEPGQLTRGVPTAAYDIEPDVGIAIDGSLASDVPYAREEDRHCTMGGGTGIYVIDSRTISNRKLVRFLVHLAEEHGIQYQMNLGGGTDASIIQRHRTGARVCTIGPPTRYMHSTVQLCHKKDIEDTIHLLTVFLENAHQGEL